VRTNICEEIGGFAVSDTTLTQNSPKDGEANMSKWPKKIKYRNKVFAKIYEPCKGRDSYRVSWMAAGKRQMKSFTTYAGDEGAKKFADELVKNLAKQSSVSLLTAIQADDAIAAIGLLNTFREATGRNISLVYAAGEYCKAAKRLKDRTLDEAITGFLRDAVIVKEINVGKAVEDFIESRKHKTESKDGKRAQMSGSYAKHVNSWLREFVGRFPGEMVSGLTKDHLNLYMQAHTDVGPKNRNDRRAALKMFLSWSVKNDYLAASHRLLEADGMTREIVDMAETDFYRPDELRKLLDKADEELRRVIAIAAFAGLRGEEIMRLRWSDVWHVGGHIELSASIAKKRQRRLVEICPALAAWLAPARKLEGKIFPRGIHVYQRHFLALRRDVAKVPDRHNGLRHAFCTYHFALHSNENLTAAQAGNSPAMIHAHYKGLATKADAERWFSVQPEKSPDTHNKS
jgi:integrase